MLFHNRPALAGELLRLLDVDAAPPARLLASARLSSASLAEIELRQYQPDGVVLFGGKESPERAVVFEVQRRVDPQKRLSWPLYVAHLRARHRCPVVLLVLAFDAAVVRWCAQPIELGHPGFVLRPIVVGAEALPHIISLEQAHSNLELAVLAALAHGSTERAVAAMQPPIEAVLSQGSPERYLYIDLMLASAGAVAKRILEEWMSQTYEYQSDLFRRLVEEGREKGREEGREEGVADAILAVLAARDLEVPATVAARIRACRDGATLDRWLARAVSAPTAEEIVR